MSEKRMDRMPHQQKSSFPWKGILFYVIMLSGIIYGMKWYTEWTQERIVSQVTQKTQTQLEKINADNEKNIQTMRQQLTDGLTGMENNIKDIHELMIFTKDNATHKSDNSNQLYSQLSAVKKQLEDLKTDLDILK
jgi:uncharacterized protein YwqG